MRLACCVAVLLSIAGSAFAWGNRTHPAIVRMAIATLPGAVEAEFRKHAGELERYSNEPDTYLRARDGRAEAIRHFIDLDGYMPAPFVEFPRTYDRAVKRIGKRNVEKYGVLPWVILRFARQLEDALAVKDPDWVRQAGYLAHYVGDAYQPLHLTVDYDGQLSGSKGIHKRFEDGVVDARMEFYEAAITRELAAASPVADLREAVFSALFRTYPAHRTILAADKVAAAAGKRGSRRYDEKLEAATADLIRAQLRDAAVMLGSIWLSSWNAAGSRVESRESGVEDGQAGLKAESGHLPRESCDSQFPTLDSRP